MGIRDMNLVFMLHSLSVTSLHPSVIVVMLRESFAILSLLHFCAVYVSANVRGDVRLCLYRYDVELFQRIEHLVGKKMPLFKTEEEEVMQLHERVAEAQRLALQVRNHTLVLNAKSGSGFLL